MESGTKLIIGIGVGAAALVAGLIAWSYFNDAIGQIGQECTGTSCPDGYTCQDNVCVENATVNPCEGLGSSCTSTGDCGTCDACIGGCCQKQEPVEVMQTNQTTGLTQDEAVPAVGALGYSYCDWNELVIPTQNKWNAIGKVVDSNGNGVPCIVLAIANPNPSEITISAPTTATNGNGDFGFAFWLNGPQAGGASCPDTGSTTTGNISSLITVSIQDTTISALFPVSITTYITGV